ncbi:MAG: DUF2116 family Zn-ribbon domain-containing protein [Bacteroidales bacterium]|nr:DUF2116 family Zn-ribbon domain-containing protein [Bacteroidales bacterium]
MKVRKNKEEKYCPVCGERIYGRSDKKFCSDECRTFYNRRNYRLKVSSIICEKKMLMSDRRLSSAYYSLKRLSGGRFPFIFKICCSFVQLFEKLYIIANKFKKP